jgi:PTS system nitrogen regulatory IIA component
LADDDFDANSLAAYLRIAPAQVEKLAGRGKLPGRKIGGKWRFARADVHHWFEEKIGVSGHDELMEVEQMLDQHDPASVGQDELISDLLTVDRIMVPLKARTKNSVIERICDHAADLGLLWDPGKMADAIRARESLHTTALESGVALLHPRRPMPSIMPDPFLILGITSSGIPFGGPRGCLSDIFFLIASTEDAGHLRVLTRLSRLVSNQANLMAFRQCQSGVEVFEVIRQSESELD